MQITFQTRDNGPERLVAEAEIHFGKRGALAGMKLVGFAIWRTADGGLFVSLPSRANGSGSDRRYFDLLRAEPGPGENVKATQAWLLEASKAEAASCNTVARPRSCRSNTTF